MISIISFNPSMSRKFEIGVVIRLFAWGYIDIMPWITFGHLSDYILFLLPVKFHSNSEIRLIVYIRQIIISDGYPPTKNFDDIQ